MMESANLPSQTDLNSLYGAWNPMSYMQGQQNQDLAAQFREQAQMGNQQALEAQRQTYNQKEITNPLEAKKLGAEATNVALQAERNTAQQQNNLDADMRSAVLKMDDDQFKTFGNHATKLAISDNPADQQKGNALLALLPSAQEERRKNQQAMDLQKEQSRSHIEGARIQAKGMLDTEQARIDAGKYDKATKTSLSIWDEVQMGKLKLREIPTAFTLAAAKEADPEQKALLLREAAKAELLLKQLPAAGQTGSIDTSAVAKLPAKTQTSLFNSPDG